MQRRNWYQVESELRALITGGKQVQPGGMMEQEVNKAVQQALNMAKNVQRGHPFGSVWTGTIWAASLDELEAAMQERKLGELFPEERELIAGWFAQGPGYGGEVMVEARIFSTTDMEFVTSSRWNYDHMGPGRSTGCTHTSSPGQVQVAQSPH